MRSAITISLIKEARGGPFVFWEDLPGSIRKAASLGFDAVEIFPPSRDAIPVEKILPLLKESKLKVSAIGTGGGWVLHKLTLTSPDADIRKRAVDFIRSMIDAAGALAPQPSSAPCRDDGAKPSTRTRRCTISKPR